MPVFAYATPRLTNHQFAPFHIHCKIVLFFPSYRYGIFTCSSIFRFRKRAPYFTPKPFRCQLLNRFVCNSQRLSVLFQLVGNAIKIVGCNRLNLFKTQWGKYNNIVNSVKNSGEKVFSTSGRLIALPIAPLPDLPRIPAASYIA